MNLTEIEVLTKRFADARGVLAERVTALQDELEAAKRRRLPGIKSSVAAAQAAREELQAALAASPAEFEKPRTRIFHGIKVGITKAKGLVKWADAARVVELIKKHLPDQAEVLIKTTEAPVKTAIANLPASDLKRIGCTIEDTGDQVVIAPTDGEVDKLVDALLKGAEAEAVEKAA